MALGIFSFYFLIKTATRPAPKGTNHHRDALGKSPHRVMWQTTRHAVATAGQRQSAEQGGPCSGIKHSIS